MFSVYGWCYVMRFVDFDNLSDLLIVGMSVVIVVWLDGVFWWVD